VLTLSRQVESSRPKSDLFAGDDEVIGLRMHGALTVRSQVPDAFQRAVDHVARSGILAQRRGSLTLLGRIGRPPRVVGWIGQIGLT
jgi:hypothetical protein